MAPHIATTTRNNSMMRPPMPGRKMRRRGNVFLNAGGKGEDDDMNKTAPFRLPNSLWTNQSDLKTPEQKCSDIYQSYATMAATRLVMAQDDGFGNECSEDVNQMLSGTSFVRSMLQSADPILRSAALRIIETRRVYVSEKEGMDWESSFRYAKEDMEQWRVKMLKRVAEKSLEGE
ncbi:unnamed protein product [Bathycoccus prasinos]